MLASEEAAAAETSHAEVDIDELLDDPELERLHAERLAQLQQEVEKRVKLQQKGHGEAGLQGPQLLVDCHSCIGLYTAHS